MKEKSENPELFFNRELSWCEFNHRVLEEAMDTANPLLERFRFAAIVASNLDEFFMVRIASLKQAIVDGNEIQCPTGKPPSEILTAVSARVHQMTSQLYDEIEHQLLPQATEQGILLRTMGSLSEDQILRLEERFADEIFPVLTPMAVDPSHPFPVLLNLSLNLGVILESEPDSDKPRLALVPIPSVLSRLWRIQENKNEFVLLEEIIRHFLPGLFAGQKILETGIFRVTRDAELELDDEGPADLLRVLEDELRKRRTNPYVRFEIEKSVGKEFLKTFLDQLAVRNEDVYQVPSLIDLRFFMTLADLPDFDRLRYKPYPPQIAVELEKPEDIWSVIRERDIVLHHPYESFEPVVRLVTEAAKDPDVLAIKQTLYRTSGDSPIIAALARAADAGKQVAVLVELMARFDEGRNIEWAKKLEEAGAHVISGLMGLKTHAKILLIVRREKGGIRRYVHLATGNYNDRTARLYTDIGLMTCDEDIGTDASGFFNTITGYSDPPEFKKLTMAPLGLRERFLHLIHRETLRARSGQPAVIHIKINSLVDPEIIRNLYEASQAGVMIRLIVRGICCLRPGIKGVSETIQVTSIVDRFLEHSRLFYFSNGGEEEYYCASADWMPRNLDRRVELLFPVTSEEGRKKIRSTFDLLFADNVKARVLQPDGSYRSKKRKKNEEPVRAQEALYQMALEERRTPRPPVFKPVTGAP